MLAVAVLAGCLAILVSGNVFGLVVIVLAIALIGARWLVFRSQRKLAAIWFGIAAVSINLLYVAACTTPISYLLPALFLACVFMFIPVIGGLGASWATLATRKTATPVRTPALAWLSVTILTVAPLLTLWTLWPLHVFFFAARPAMERLADQSATGQPFNGPRWIGVFRLAGSSVDFPTGEVALLVDANPNGPSGFVRCAGSLSCGGPAHLIHGSNLRVHLGGDWWYNEDD